MSIKIFVKRETFSAGTERHQLVKFLKGLNFPAERKKEGFPSAIFFFL